MPWSRSSRLYALIFLVLLIAAPAICQPAITLPDNVTWFTGPVRLDLTAMGGNQPFSWTALSPLPDGVRLRTDYPAIMPAGVTATLSGVATTAGDYPVRVKVTDALGTSSEKVIKITVSSLTGLSYWELPDATVGVFYTQNYPVTGGSPPYSYSASGFPPGISINPTTGTISGTPASAGSFYPYIFATDSTGLNRGFGARIQVSAMRFSTGPLLPSVAAGAPYLQSIGIIGGTAPYNINVGCCLPGGITASVAGNTVTLAGTPSYDDNTNNFSINVTDAAGGTLRGNFVAFIHKLPRSQPMAGDNKFDDVTLGVWENRNIGTSHGQGPYTYALAPGSSLPPGMSLATDLATFPWWYAPNNAQVAGTPLTAGTYTFTVRITDSSPAPVTTERTYTLGISKVRVDFPTSPTYNVAYADRLGVYGGTPPYNIAMIEGALPLGLTLNPATGAITGTPQEAGSFYARFRIADSASPVNTYTRGWWFWVGNGSTSQVSFWPTGDIGQFQRGSALSYRFNASAGGGTYVWSTPALPAAQTPAGYVSGLPPGLSLGAAGSQSLLSGTPTTAGLYAFLIQAADGAAPSNAMVRLILMQVSDFGFTSVPSPAVANVGTPIAPLSLAVGGTRPNGTVTYSVESGYFPPGLTLSPGGTVTGTPSVAGLFGFTIRATETVPGQPTFVARTYQEWPVYAAGAALPLNLTFGPDLGRQDIGGADWSLAPTGGKPPYTLSLAPGAASIPGFRLQSGPPLPSWYSATQVGSFLGVATTAGTFQTTIRVTDSAGAFLDRPVNLVVAGVQAGPERLPEAAVGEAYSFTLWGTGGTPPYSYSVSGISRLPVGLSLSSSGLLSGIPTAADENYWVYIHVQDAAGDYFDAPYYLPVRALRYVSPTPANRLLPSATYNQNYAPVTLTVAGGTPPYTFSLAYNDNLPSGMTLSTGGVISGTPVSTGWWSPRILVIDSAGNQLYRQFGVYVSPNSASPLGLYGNTFSDQTVGDGYRLNIQAYNGVPPYTYSVAPGSTLPPGTRLIPNYQDTTDWSAQSASVAGRTLTPGTWTFSIQVADSAGNTAVNTYSVRAVVLKPQDTFMPRGSNIATVNSPFSQYMLALGGTPPYTFTYRSTAPVGLSLSPAGLVSGTPLTTGQSYTPLTIADSVGNSVNTGSWINVTAPGGIPTLMFYMNQDLGTWRPSYQEQRFQFGPFLGNPVPPYDIWLAPGSTLPPGLYLLKGADLPSTSDNAPVLAGRATTPGQYSFTLQARDAAGGFGQKYFTLRVSTLGLTGSYANYASIGVPYSSHFTVYGAVGATSYALTSGIVPAGLGLDTSTGVLSGIPTTAGTYSFCVTVTDSTGASVQSCFSITVAPFSITTAALPIAKYGQPYSFKLTASPATPASGSYQWTSDYGTSINGLTLDPVTGMISGNPYNTNSDYMVSFTLGNGVTSVSKYLMLSFRATTAAPLAINNDPGNLGDGNTGQRYVAQVVLNSGGVPPFTVDAPSPALLPPGLAVRSYTDWYGGLDYPSRWVLAGLPTKAGTYTFPLRVTDSAGLTAQRTFTVRIVDFAVVQTSLRNAYYGQPYEAQLLVDGCAGCTFAMAEANGPYNVLPPGLSLSPSGKISGTPSATGNYGLYLTVASGAARKTEYRLLRVYALATPDRAVSFGSPAITAPLSLGIYFTTTFYPSDGTGTLTWSLTPGSNLPPGISLTTASDSAQLVGIPQTAGTYTFGLRVDDAAGNFGVRVYTVVVSKMNTVPNLVGNLVGPATWLTRGKVGAPYSYTFAMSNATAPVTFSLGGGSYLPPGVTLGPSGLLSGTPAESGYFTIWLNARDASGAGYQRGYTWTVFGTSLGLGWNGSGAAVTASAGQPFAADLNQLIYPGYATGPFTWTIDSGNLPAGLALIPGAGSTSARIVGTPTGTGSWTAAFRATDSTGLSEVGTLYFTVSALNVTPADYVLPGATAGAPYSVQLTAAGGAPAYTFKRGGTSSMPVGLDLSTAGVLSGTPSTAGAFNVSVDVTDSSGLILSKRYLLNVAPAGTVTPSLIVKPSAINVTWSGGAIPPPVPVAVTSSAGPLSFTVSASTEKGAWLTVTPASATTPATVNVLIDPTGLSVGAYNGAVAFSSPAAQNSPVTIPVTLTVSQSTPCAYSLGSGSGTASAAGGNISFSLTTEATCSWSASSDSAWARITTAGSGTGPGIITITADPNPSPSKRTAAITAGGESFALTQFGAACEFTLAPTSLSSPAASGSAILTITASNASCTWTAVPGAAWIKPATTGGKGSGTITVNLDANGAPGSRSSSLTVGGVVLPVTQAGTTCNFSLGGPETWLPYTGGIQGVNLNVASGCEWKVTPSDNWIVLTTPPSGSGTTLVFLNVQPNSSTQTRSGTVLIGGQTYTVRQGGVPCDFSLGLDNPVQPAAGGTGHITITANGGCPWVASSNAEWIVLSASSGAGNTLLPFTVKANPGTASRSGSITVAGQNIVVTQGGTVCSYSLRSDGATMPSSGGDVAAGVVAAGSCAWTAVSNASWVKVKPGSAAGTGPADVQLTVDPNPDGQPRSGTLIIAGRTFAVTEDALACSISPPGAPAGVGELGGATGFTYTAGCKFDAVSYNGWIEVTGNNYDGSQGTVSLVVAQNNSPAPRSGSVKVGNYFFTVTQAASTCAYNLTSINASYGRSGGAGSVPFTASAAACVPAVAVNAPSGMLQLGALGKAGASFEQNYTVGPYNAIVPYIRQGQIGVNGQFFTVKQKSW